MLITNAISNKRNEVKLLNKQSENIGGKSLLVYNYKKNLQKNSTGESKYLVETILLDDIVDFLPLNANNQTHKKAILKIDIEGFEPYAFQYSKRLFDTIDIEIIFMEWGSFVNEVN